MKERMEVRLFTDSEPTLESIASSRQVERKTLRHTIMDPYACSLTEQTLYNILNFRIKS